MNLSILRLLAAVVIAFFAGKLISKLKLPSILGWLIAGMILGPHALSLINDTLLDTVWYQSLMHVLECAVGLMIGTELVWKKIKKSGRSIIVTTLTQSLGTFLLVSLVFGIVFYFSGIPLYLAFLFGGIALATTPAPALSIVREFKTSGPVTSTLIPMAALDDIVGCIVFFTTIALVAGNLSTGELPAYMIVLVVLLPLVIGVVTGLLAGLVLKKRAWRTCYLDSSDHRYSARLRRRFSLQQPASPPGAQLHAYRNGIFSHLLQYDDGGAVGADHEGLQPNPRRIYDYGNSQPRRAAGLPLDIGGRVFYSGLYHCPCPW